MRPGLCMRGEVVMAPSAMDVRNPDHWWSAFWLAHSRIYLDGRVVHGVEAYNEDTGMVMVRSIDGVGHTMMMGNVRALPASGRF